MENKTNKGLVWLVVILIVLVVTLMGFIVYREFYSEEKSSVNNTKTNNVEKNENKITNIENFPKKSDNSILTTFYLKELLYDEDGKSLVNEKENFQNITYHTSNNIKYSISCDIFLEDDGYDGSPLCDTLKINLNDYNADLYFYNGVGCSDETFVILTNNYILEQRISGCGDGGAINIIDKKGNIVFTENNSVYKYSNSTDYEDENEVKIAVIDNVLYYVSYTEDSIQNNKLYFNSVNLSTLKKQEIQQINGFAFGLE